MGILYLAHLHGSTCIPDQNDVLLSLFYSIWSGIILSASAHRQPYRPDRANHKRPWTSANAAETHSESWKWRKQANWIQKFSFTHLPQWACREAGRQASEPCCWHLQNHACFLSLCHVILLLSQFQCHLEVSSKIKLPFKQQWMNQYKTTSKEGQIFKMVKIFRTHCISAAVSSGSVCISRFSSSHLQKCNWVDSESNNLFTAIKPL